MAEKAITLEELKKLDAKQLNDYDNYWITSTGQAYHFEAYRGKYVKKEVRQNNGYVYLRVNQNHDKKSLAVHRLVAQYFINDGEDLKINQVHHRNRIKSDNYYKNLQIVDQDLHSTITQKQLKQAELDQK